MSGLLRGCQEHRSFKLCVASQPEQGAEELEVGGGGHGSPGQGTQGALGEAKQHPHWSRGLRASP